MHTVSQQSASTGLPTASPHANKLQQRSSAIESERQDVKFCQDVIPKADLSPRTTAVSVAPHQTHRPPASMNTPRKLIELKSFPTDCVTTKITNRCKKRFKIVPTTSETEQRKGSSCGEKPNSASEMFPQIDLRVKSPGVAKESSHIDEVTFPTKLRSLLSGNGSSPEQKLLGSNLTQQQLQTFVSRNNDRKAGSNNNTPTSTSIKRARASFNSQEQINAAESKATRTDKMLKRRKDSVAYMGALMRKAKKDADEIIHRMRTVHKVWSPQVSGQINGDKMLPESRSFSSKPFATKGSSTSPASSSPEKSLLSRGRRAGIQEPRSPNVPESASESTVNCGSTRESPAKKNETTVSDRSSFGCKGALKSKMKTALVDSPSKASLDDLLLLPDNTNAVEEKQTISVATDCSSSLTQSGNVLPTANMGVDGALISTLPDLESLFTSLDTGSYRLSPDHNVAMKGDSGVALLRDEASKGRQFRRVSPPGHQIEYRNLSPILVKTAPSQKDMRSYLAQQQTMLQSLLSAERDNSCQDEITAEPSASIDNARHQTSQNCNEMKAHGGQCRSSLPSKEGPNETAVASKQKAGEVVTLEGLRAQRHYVAQLARFLHEAVSVVLDAGDSQCHLLALGESRLRRIIGEFQRLQPDLPDTQWLRQYLEHYDSTTSITKELLRRVGDRTPVFGSDIKAFANAMPISNEPRDEQNTIHNAPAKSCSSTALLMAADAEHKDVHLHKAESPVGTPHTDRGTLFISISPVSAASQFGDAVRSFDSRLEELSVQNDPSTLVDVKAVQSSLEINSSSIDSLRNISGSSPIVGATSRTVQDCAVPQAFPVVSNAKSSLYRGHLNEREDKVYTTISTECPSNVQQAENTTTLTQASPTHDSCCVSTTITAAVAAVEALEVLQLRPSSVQPGSPVICSGTTDPHQAAKLVSRWQTTEKINAQLEKLRASPTPGDAELLMNAAEQARIEREHRKYTDRKIRLRVAAIERQALDLARMSSSIHYVANLRCQQIKDTPCLPTEQPGRERALEHIQLCATGSLQILNMCQRVLELGKRVYVSDMELRFEDARRSCRGPSNRALQRRREDLAALRAEEQQLRATVARRFENFMQETAVRENNLPPLLRACWPSIVTPSMLEDFFHSHAQIRPN